MLSYMFYECLNDAFSANKLLSVTIYFNETHTTHYHLITTNNIIIENVMSRKNCSFCIRRSIITIQLYGITCCNLFETGKLHTIRKNV